MRKDVDQLSTRVVNIRQVPQLCFGDGCSTQFVRDAMDLGIRRFFLVTTQSLSESTVSLVAYIEAQGCSVVIDDSINKEPTVESFKAVLHHAQTVEFDAVLGIGGGSVLDVAKLVAVHLESDLPIQDVFGIGKPTTKFRYLICLPTTSGTGSEVSPNAILLDERDQLKKGVVSPRLVPDAVYIDPVLTASVPPDVTAATGLDALTHCIEAFANRYAHPLTDLYASKGIELIGGHLESAFRDGGNEGARRALSLGSLYGGLCLGPVNTAAVHALAYPLGGTFHIPHGVANAMLLPGVLKFNVSAAPERYAQMALALGCRDLGTDMETARGGIERIKQISRSCDIPSSLAQFGVRQGDLERLVPSALSVTRLLKNNPRDLGTGDVKAIYQGLL